MHKPAATQYPVHELIANAGARALSRKKRFHRRFSRVCLKPRVGRPPAITSSRGRFWWEPGETETFRKILGTLVEFNQTWRSTRRCWPSPSRTGVREEWAFQPKRLLRSGTAVSQLTTEATSRGLIRPIKWPDSIPTRPSKPSRFRMVGSRLPRSSSATRRPQALPDGCASASWRPGRASLCRNLS